MKNGSIFFVDAGQGVFGVTAAHVVVECLRDTKSPMFVQCMIGRHGEIAHPFHLGDHVIDAHKAIDIATLRFSPAEVVLGMRIWRKTSLAAASFTGMEWYEARNQLLLSTRPHVDFDTEGRPRHAASWHTNH